MIPAIPRLAMLSLTVAAVALSSLDDGPAWDLASPAPVVFITPARLDGLQALSCGECHAAVVDEWASTAHALSWVDETYQEEIGDRRRPELCHGCHVPEPMIGADGPTDRAVARTTSLHLGVSCDSCHLGPDGEQLGPRGAPTEAHATTRSEWFVGAGSNALCAGCHSSNIGPVVGVAADFLESEQAGRGRSCVGCHMAPVQRALGATAAGEVPDGAPSARVVRSHALQTPRDPAFLARAFGLAVDDGGSLLLSNRAGHRVPGLKGREISFVVEALGPDGALLERVEHTFDTRSYLPVDGEQRVPVAAPATSLRVIGRHRDPRADEPLTFLDVRLPVAR